MDARDVLLMIAALRIKWRTVSESVHKEFIRRKLLRLISIHDIMKIQEDDCQKTRKYWVRPIFTEESRLRQAASNNLVREMEVGDHEKYVNYFRMSPELFEKLLASVEPSLTKQTVVRDPIPARTRLEICLRYLASGDSMTSISYAFRIGHNTVSKIVAEGCEQIWEILKDSVFIPVNSDNWKAVAESFEEKWNFPNCIGAIDGKHVVLQAPPNSGSTFYNYKGSHSLVLLACSDAHYRFTLVDIGAEGRQSDGGIFRNSQIGQRFEENSLQLPLPRCIGDSDGPILPFVLLGHEAFPLSKYMMRPYPRSGALNRTKKVFNYRLSRGRRVIESAFGIMAAKWRIYRKPIIASVSTATKIVQATCCLHNYILSHEAEIPAKQRFYSVLTNEERCAVCDGIRDIENAGSAMYNANATRIREKYAKFFEGEGSVPWQWEKAMMNDF